MSALAFLRRLCADLSDICGQPINVTGDEGDVPTTLIQPIGLIANEFITNAVKHGGGGIGIASGSTVLTMPSAFATKGQALRPASTMAKTEASG